MAFVGMAKDSGRTGRSPRLDRALSGVLAGVIAAAGLSMVPLSEASAAANPGMSVAPMPIGGAVSLAQAGEVVMWGPGMARFTNDQGQATVPASLARVAVTQLALSDTVTLALTAAGKVVSWGANAARLERVPDAVSAAKVAQVTANSANYAGVVTRDGQVLTWGRKTGAGSPLDVQPGLSGVKQLALTQQNAIALKTDGSVVAWGSTEVPGLNTPPAGLKATAITAGPSTAYALTTSGTVVGWGGNSSGELDLPAAVTQPGNVKAVAAVGGGAVALLNDPGSTLVVWGNTLSPGLKTWVPDQPSVAITSTQGWVGLVDSDGVVHQMGITDEDELDLPAGLDGRAMATFAVGADDLYPWGGMVVTKMLRGEDPTISGTATVGRTLTATPGTFSASPTTVTSQWLANGSPIAGATGTTLPLTAAQLGKQITYQSTAAKAGETTISSTSAAVTVTNPPQPPVTKVASKTKVAKVKVAKKAASVSVTGKVTAAKPVTGKATVTIKKGKKTIVAKTVKVSAKGTVALTVKKFGKLAVKKTKSKKKNGYRGSYTVTITYAGNSHVKPSRAGKKFQVK
jgi:hypothetical protein